MDEGGTAARLCRLWGKHKRTPEFAAREVLSCSPSSVANRSLLPLLALLAVLADTTPVVADTACYENAALRILVAEAAEVNRRVPPTLGGYTAELESEISIGNRRSERMEMSVQLEQIASRLSWDRTGQYEQTVIGYRSQSIGTSIATLGFFRAGWAIPSLYGNRLALLFGRDTTESRRRRRDRRGGEPQYAIHPLAEDRDAYYRFSGGDTIFTMRVEGREIPIVRLDVQLRDDVPNRSVVFVGELDLDATRKQLVRLRGYFAVVGGPKPRFDIIREARLQGIAFVEAVNSEVDGNFWLPAYQRFEAHATSNTVGESRAIFRIITRYRDREILPIPEGVVVGAPEDSLSVRPFRLRVESRDTLSSYSNWRRELGAENAAVRAEDFDDVAPDQWSTKGPPRFSIETERLLDVLRIDRIQGVFTGVGAVYRYRDVAPGVALRGALGYSWGERTVRGRAIVEHRRGRTLTQIRAVRSLDLTNDFRSPYDSGSTTAALWGRDWYDYVDRRTAGLLVQHNVGRAQDGFVRLEVAAAQDRDVRVNMTESPVGLGQPFRPNRAVTPGDYARSVITFEWRPDVALEFLRPGMGARLIYERADGQLRYQRAEARFTSRLNFGGLAFGARLDVGAVTPDGPPQQFFELGSNQNLPGYDYKQFAGDQAAVLRGQVFHGFGIWGAPIRLSPRVWLPPISPGLAVGVQAGYARASNAVALNTVQLLGSETTGHVRSSAAVTLRLFGQAVGVGMARPLDYPAQWRWILEFGQRF